MGKQHTYATGETAKMGPYSLLDLTIFLAAVTRFDHCAADSEAQPHSSGFTGLLGLGRGKYNNILQQL